MSEQKPGPIRQMAVWDRRPDPRAERFKVHEKRVLLATISPYKIIDKITDAGKAAGGRVVQHFV
jgi:hypothetical protein